MLVRSSAASGERGAKPASWMRLEAQLGGALELEAAAGEHAPAATRAESKERRRETIVGAGRRAIRRRC